MQVLNLLHEFELRRMQESEIMKEYSDRLLNITNCVRLFALTFNNSSIIENFLVKVPKKHEATSTTLENTKDLSYITLVELLVLFQHKRNDALYMKGLFNES